MSNWQDTFILRPLSWFLRLFTIINPHNPTLPKTAGSWLKLMTEVFFKMLMPAFVQLQFLHEICFTRHVCRFEESISDPYNVMIVATSAMSLGLIVPMLVQLSWLADGSVHSLFANVGQVILLSSNKVSMSQLARTLLLLAVLVVTVTCISVINSPTMLSNVAVYPVFVFVVFGWLINVYLFPYVLAWFCELLKNAAENLNSELVEYQVNHVKGDKKRSHEDLHRLFVAHGRLRSALDSLDRAFSPYLLLYLVLQLPVVILKCYCLLTTPHLSPTMTGLFIMTAASNVWYIGLVVWQAATLQDQLQETPVILTGIDAIWTSESRVFEIALAFYMRAKDASGPQLCGLGALNKGFIVTVTSAVITYLTLLYQFKPDAINEADNSTVAENIFAAVS